MAVEVLLNFPIIRVKNGSGRIRPEEEVFGGTATRCQITNYGPVPIVDLTFTLDLSFYRVIPVPNQPGSQTVGALKLRRPWIVDVQKIDAGPANSFTFYIFNTTKDTFVNVFLPKTAELRRLGEKTRETVILDVPRMGVKFRWNFGP